MFILIQNIWSNLKKEPLVSLFFVIQIAITSFIIFNTCFETKYSLDQLASVNTAFSDYKFYAFGDYGANMSSSERDDYYFGTNEAMVTERLDEVVEEIRQLQGVTILVNNYSGALQVFDGLAHFDPKDKNDENALVFWANETSSQWDHCRIDKAFFDMFPVRLDSGRFFTDEEFELTYEAGSTVPVLLGYGFKKYYDIGDVLETSLNWNIPEEVVKVEVIGFIAEDEVCITETGADLFSYNNRIVSPFNYRRMSEYTDAYKKDGKYRNSLFSIGIKGMYFLVDKENEANIVDAMNLILESYDLNSIIRFRKYLGSTTTVANNYRENMSVRLALTYITVIFSFISIILFTINRITANIRNYAIHLISGGTYKNIYMYVIGEIIVYSIFGFILGSNAYIARNLYYNYVANLTVYSEFGFNLGWMICFSMLILFVLISLVIVVVRMTNIDLSSVLRDKVYSDGSRGSVYKVVTVSAFAIISFCIIFAISYLTYLNGIDMYYRSFYTENTKLVSVTNDPNLPQEKEIKADYQNLGDNYVIDKFVSISSYSELAPYIRGTYYKGDVALPEMRSGRYFTEEELNSKKGSNIAVIGQKAYEDFAFKKDDGKEYFSYAGKEYEIIGIMGREDGTETKIDEWVFLPLNTVLSQYGYTGSFFIDGPSKTDIQNANDLWVSQLESCSRIESRDQEYTAVALGPTDALVSLAIMIAINIIIVCIYYTDKKHYTVAVKKFIGYSKGMVFGDIFAGFLRWASVGYGIGIAIIITILLTPLKDFIMFKTLSLNIPTILISFIATALLALIFAAIAINRTYNRDTSEVLRG